MEYKFKYKDLIERELIFSEHNDLFLKEELNINEGNFLIFTDIQLQNQDQEIQDLSSRVSDISMYLNNSNETTIADIENSILQKELNKVNGGM